MSVEFKTARLERTELAGMACGVLLAASTIMPWFSNDGSNPNSKVQGVHGGPDGAFFNAWQSFDYVQYFLLLLSVVPFVLAWIIARGHDLEWPRGEVTAIAGAIAGMVILFNTIIHGQPGTVSVYPSWGVLVALIASTGILFSGAMRATKGRKKEPPGV